MLPRLSTLSGLATTLVVVLAATACGGSDDEPGGQAEAAPVATVDDFCPTWEEALTTLATLGADPSEEDWDEVRARLEDLQSLGAPDELSADAAAGLAVFTDSLIALDHRDVARLQGAPNLPGVTDEQEAQSRSFTGEAAQLCGKLG